MVAYILCKQCNHQWKLQGWDINLKLCPCCKTEGPFDMELGGSQPPDWWKEPK